MKEKWMMSQYADLAELGENIEMSPLKLIKIAVVDQVAYLFDIYSTVMTKEPFKDSDLTFSQFWDVYKSIIAATNEKFLDAVTKDYTKDMLESQLLFMQDGKIMGWPLK